MLTAEQCRQYATEGYIIVHGFFDRAEVRAIQAELDQMVAANEGRNVATDGDGSTPSTKQVNFQIIPLSPKSRLFRALPFSRKVRESVEQLIGPRFVLQLDQIFLKPAHHGAGTSWHQDNAYFGIRDPLQGVGMWTAVHDATIANGTMHIVPRSHETAREHVRDGNSDHHITCRVDETHDRVIPVEMKAGGVLFFNYGIAHCTKGNHTDHPRAGLALHFLRTEFTEEGRARGPVRPHLAGPEYSAGVKEWGENLEGAWEAAVVEFAR